MSTAGPPQAAPAPLWGGGPQEVGGREGPIRWSWHRFAELGAAGVYEVLGLRQQVFGVEQNCPYLDTDGLDPRCWHLRGHSPEGELLAYLRLVDAGVKYAEPSIGRVVTAQRVRRTGLGRALVAEGLAGHARLWPGLPNRIGAQARLEAFYESFGWRRAGENYIEDGIPHLEMRRPAA